MAKTENDEATQAAKDSITPAVGSADQKAAAAKLAEDSTDGSHVSQDYFTNPDVKALTQLPTALDHQGNERIIGVSADGWALPPSKLSDDEIKAAKDRESKEEENRKIRLSGGASAQELTSDESSAANASQGVGGSGSSV